MIVGGSLLAHGEKWAATVDDIWTVRRIRDELIWSLADHLAVASEITDAEARADFEAVFADDVRRCEAVIATCIARLEKET